MCICFLKSILDCRIKGDPDQMVLPPSFFLCLLLRGESEMRSFHLSHNFCPIEGRGEGRGEGGMKRQRQ